MRHSQAVDLHNLYIFALRFLWIIDKCQETHLFLTNCSEFLCTNKIICLALRKFIIMKAILAVLTVLTLCSCGAEYFNQEPSDEYSKSSNKNTRLVSFDVSSNGIAVTKADTDKKTLKDFFSTLQYWIFDEDYSNVKASGSQKSTDSNFGSFSAELAIGSTYHVVVVGHNRATMTLEADNIVKLNSSSTFHSNTYYGNLECKMSSNGADKTSISLTRNMCCVKIVSKGPHTNVGSLGVSIDAFGTDIKAQSGFANTSKVSTTKKYILSDTNRADPNIYLTFYFPMPDKEENKNVSITLTAYALDNTTATKTITIDNVPAKAGRMITYNGSLAQNSQDFTVEIPTDDWEKLDEIMY